MQRKGLLIAFFCAALVLSSTKSVAQWRAINNGLYGSEVELLYTHNGVVYESGTNGTLYRSLNGGSQWQVSGVDLVRGSAVMASTATYDILSCNGVWLTNDQGVTWKPRGLDSVSFFSMMVRGDTVLGATPNGFYKSTDQGLHWQICSNNGKPATDFWSCVQIGKVVFAATHDSVFQSTDDGESWQATSNFDVNSVKDVSLSAQGDTLIACVNGDHLFVSMDTARSWYSSSVPLSTQRVQQHDSLLLAVTGYALYYSSDFGASWEQRKNLARSIGSLVTAWLGDTLLLGNSQGVFRSVDHGFSWTPCNQGLENTTVSCYCSSDTMLYAGTRSNGAFRSSDGGESWVALTDTSSFDYGVQCMLSLGDTVFAAAQRKGVLASSNRGQSWNVSISGLNSGVYTRALAKGNNILYCAGGTSGGSIYTSTDQGSHWSLHNDGLPNLFQVSDIWASGDTAIIAGDSGVFASSDRGLHWAAINSGIEGIGISSCCSEGRNIWATSDSLGAFYSSDFGQSWTLVNYGISNLNLVFIRRSGNFLVTIAGHELYMISNGTKYYHPGTDVYVSTDNGLHWKSIKANLGTTLFSSASLVGQNIYIGLWGTGVHTAKLTDFDLSLDVPQGDEAIRPTGTFAFHQSLPASFIAPFIAKSGLTLVDILGRSKKHWSAQELQAATALDISDLEEGVYSVESAGCRTTILVY